MGNGAEGDTFWIATEHGRKAGYVRNLEHAPEVRVRFRHGIRLRLRTGTAHLVPEERSGTAPEDPGTRPPVEGAKRVVVFPNEDAARKLIYLALANAVPQWTRCRNWTTALLAFKIHFGDRLPDTAT